MAARRYLLEKRVLVNGKTSQINLDNYLDLREYIALVALGSTSSSTPLTFENGLTKDAFNVATLGGTLTANTTIIKSTFFFRTIGEGTNLFRSENATVTSLLSTTTSASTVSSTNAVSGAQASLVATNTGNLAIAVADGGTISSGLTVDTATGNVMSYTADGVTVARISMVPDIGDTTIGVKMTSCIPTYADEAAAGAANLTTGSLYKTALGALMIKL